MASSTPNRLLAMLNSSASSQHTQPSQPTPPNPNSTLTGKSSPREPTPAPSGPPMSLQSLSLQDLFKNIAPLPTRSEPAAVNPSLTSPPFVFGSNSAEPTVVTSSPTANSTSPATTQLQNGQGSQQNRLLGMLRNISNPPASAQKAAVTQSTATEGGKEGQSQLQDGYSKTETEAHRQVKNLLAGLKQESPKSASDSSPSPAVQPIPINSESTAQASESETPTATKETPSFPTSSESASSATLDQPTQTGVQSTPNHAKSNNVDPAIAAVLPPVHTTPAAPPLPIAKSPFHFVSPFDAFGPPSPSVPSPRTRTTSTHAAPPAAGRKISHSNSSSLSTPTTVTAPAPAVNGASSILGKRPGSALDRLMPVPPAPKVSSPAEPTPTVVPENQTPIIAPKASAEGTAADVKPTKADLAAVNAKSAAQANMNGSSKANSRPVTPSKKVNGIQKVQETVSTPSSGKAGEASAAKSSAVPAPGRKGKGSSRMSQHTVIDLSQPTSDALLADKDAVHIVPAAILKSQPVAGFQTGRAVAVTQGWMAYALSSGRIRLIDRDSGSRIALQVPQTSNSTSGPIKDLAVTPTSVAAVGSDGSVTVFRVPAQWNRDEPPCEQILYIPAETGVGGEDQILGPVSRVEIVERSDEGDKVAICGPGGLVLIDVNQEGGQAEMKDLAERYKVMTTEGRIAGFCLNQSQHAIALISDASHLTIYSVASSARVFHKQLPSADIASSPTSVQFCESNLLIGRKDNTLLELVQITSDISILGSIHFASSTNSDFCQVVYDPTRCIVWVTSHSKGSLYGFQYALKGRPPIPAVEQEGIVAFSKMVEIPLDRVFSLGIAREVSEGPELIYAHKKGVSLGMVFDTVVDKLRGAVVEEESESVEEDSEDEVEIEEESGEKYVEYTQAEEVPVKKEKEAMVAQTTRESAPSPPPPTPRPLPPHQQVRSAPVPALSSNATKAVDEEEDNDPVIVEKHDPKAAAEEATRQMKKMEDRIVTQFRQALSAQVGGVNTRIEAIGGDQLAGEIGDKVEKGLKGYIAELVKDEIKKSVIPALASSVKTELTAALPSLISSSLNDTLRQTLPKDLDRVLVPVVQQSVAQAVQASVDRTVHDAIKRVVLPGVMQGMAKMFEGLAGELKGDILQMRKDLTPPPAQPDVHALQLKSMAESMADLQRQLAVLSEQVRAAPSAPIAPPMTQQQQQQQQQQQHRPATVDAPRAPVPTTYQAPAPAPPTQLEDAFLSALSATSVSSTLSLLNAHYHATDLILPVRPNPNTPPLLSQAVLLTLYHRLALALLELPRDHPAVNSVIQWERRVAGLLDPRSTTGGDIASFYPRVVSAVRDILEGVIQRYGPGDAAGRALREVLEVVAQRG